MLLAVSSIPRTAFAAAGVNSDDERSARSRRPAILHVEDDPDLRLITHHLLAGEGSVTSVEDLAGAREQLATGEFDLLLLDLRLPDGCGLDLLAELYERNEPTPVVIFSAYELRGSEALHAARVLVKSRDSAATLKLAVRDLLETKH